MSTQLPELTVGERLDRLELTRIHYLILALLGSTLFFDNFESFMSGAVLGAMVKSGFSNPSHNVYFLTATYGGFAIGAFVSGILSERFGSRTVFRFNLALLGLSSIACAFAPDIFWLSAIRTLTGLAMGGEFVVALSLAAEFMPNKARARTLAGIGVAMALTAFVSNYVSYLVIPTIGWRFMFVIPGIAALLLLVLRQWVPESPRWLQSQGNRDESEKIVRRIEGDQYRPCRLADAPSQMTKTDVTVGEIFRGELKVRTLVACVLTSGVSFGGFTFSSWLPTFLIQKGFSVSWALGFTTIISLGIPAGALIGFLLGNLVGRKAGMLVAIVVGALAIMLYPLAQTAAFAALFGFIFGMATYYVGMNTNFYISEIFPTGCRYRGAGVAHSVAKVVAVISPFLVSAVYQSFGESAAIGLIAGTFVIMGIVLAIWGIETMSRPLDAALADVRVESAEPGPPRFQPVTRSSEDRIL